MKSQKKSSVFELKDFLPSRIVLLSILLIVLSCNNDPKTSEEKKDTIQTVTDTARKVADTTRPKHLIKAPIDLDCNIPSYTFTAAQQEEVWERTNYNRIRSLNWYFTFRDDCPAQLFVCGNDDIFCVTRNIELTPIAGSEVNLAGRFTEQANTRGDFKVFYDEKNRVGQVVPIEAKFQDIILTPRVDNNGNICFDIRTAATKGKKTKKFDTEMIYTNPSPPATPCSGTDCDELTQQ